MDDIQQSIQLDNLLCYEKDSFAILFVLCSLVLIGHWVFSSQHFISIRVNNALKFFGKPTPEHENHSVTIVVDIGQN